MPNFKSLTDDQLWWKSQPGNRGKDVPSPEEARAAYGRYGRQANKNVDTVSSGLDSIRKFIFRDSDARKQPVEDAVNARRDAGKSIPLEPYVKPASKEFVPIDLSYKDAEKASRDPKVSLDDDIDTIAQGQTVKRGGTIKKYAKGGKISLDNCKVSTHQKSKKHPNW